MNCLGIPSTAMLKPVAQMQKQGSHLDWNSQHISCWAPNFSAFSLLGSLKYFLGNSLYIRSDLIQFQLVPFDFDYFNSIMQNFNVFLIMILRNIVNFLTVLFLTSTVSYLVKFLPSLSPTLLLFDQCCVGILSVCSCLKLKPAQYLKVAEQIWQIVLDLSTVSTIFSWRAIIFPHSRSKRCRWIHNHLVIRHHVWEHDSECAAHSTVGRRTTFLPSNTKWCMNCKTLCSLFKYAHF